MSTMNTEAAMAALFALAQTANTPATPFKIMSRRMRHFNDVPVNEMPCLFQFQAPGIRTHGGERGIPVKERQVWWMVYLPGNAALNQVVSTQMNQYYDALSNLLLKPLGLSKNTLGGLCVDCYEDGQSLCDEGLLSTPSLISISIKMLNGI